jgi:hypothetical protein
MAAAAVGCGMHSAARLCRVSGEYRSRGRKMWGDLSSHRLSPMEVSDTSQNSRKNMAAQTRVSQSHPEDF